MIIKYLINEGFCSESWSEHKIAIKFGFNWTFHSIYLPKPTLLTFDNMNASEIVITEPYKHISLSEFQRH